MASSSSKLEKLTMATASTTVTGTSSMVAGGLCGETVVWDIRLK